MEREERSKKLLERRIIGLGDNINKETVDRICSGIVELNLTSSEEIKLVIDSGGGQIEPALYLFDMIKNSKAPVIGVVIGGCGSSAVSVLQSCCRRLSTPNSRFFLHFVSHNDFSFKLNQSESEVVEVLRVKIKEAQVFQKTTEDILLARTKMTREQLRELMQNGEKYRSKFTPDEALVLGLIDEIVERYDLF
ncbi:MAG: ATP-dependent Clp protease proteolytic subunit [Parcubacteria group bacterium]|nr:ATP-dependent Clp protease proteolytic subunit [Parcubacteria group bacterium]